MIFLSPIISIPSRVSEDRAVESHPGLVEALVCVYSGKRPMGGFSLGHRNKDKSGI